jgi:hypothetical protein
VRDEQGTFVRRKHMTKVEEVWEVSAEEGRKGHIQW